MTGPCATLPAVSDAAPQRPDHGGTAALSAEDIVAATGGTLLARSDRPVRGGAVDSRLVTPGALFVALPGERVDGHAYVAEAVAAGAAAVLVGRPLDDRAVEAVAACPGGATVVLVGDPLAGLQRVASSWRARFSPLTVGITGSVGKTSVKEAVAAVLSARFRTLRTPGNANNEVGLPLTLLRLDADVQAAVLEMGMYTGGEIADLARMGRPSIGVVTAVAPVHLERAGSLEAIADAKAELVEALPAEGVAVLNADDPVVRAFDRRTAARTVRYGTDEDADVRVERIRAAGLAGTAFTLVADGARREVLTPALGRHSALNGAAAAAVGLVAGLGIDDVAAALSRGWSADHRIQLVDMGRWLILDDTYNAAPASMLAALEVLSTLPGRRMAVLGEMLELGDLSDAGHRGVGEAAGRTVDVLVTVGAGADRIAVAAAAAGLANDRIHRAVDRAAAATVVRGLVRDGDVVLVKASRGAALDLLVADLRAADGAR